VLALYNARSKNAPRTNETANQLAALIAAETDGNRLAYYRADVHGMAPRIIRMCEPETARRLIAVLADRFPVNAPGDEVAAD
jgi:hypothetical protein